MAIFVLGFTDIINAQMADSFARGVYVRGKEDTDEFMSAAEFVQYLEDYARSFHAPLRTNTNVVQISCVEEEEENLTSNKNSKGASPTRFKIVTEDGSTLLTTNIVLATGYCDLPSIPIFASNLSPSVQQYSVVNYKRPSQVLSSINNNRISVEKSQMILIVGSGASGLQIAQELALAAKDNNNNIKVAISVGRHCRWPRTYRGKDILWWVDQMGLFQSPASQTEEASNPGPQLAGYQDHYNISLYDLKQQHGKTVELVGRVTNITSEKVECDSDSLVANLQEADDKCILLARAIDAFAEKEGIDAVTGKQEEEGFCQRLPYESLPKINHLNVHDLNCVIWATGFCRSYPFLSDDLTNRLWDSERKILCNQGGITPQPGMYVLGYRWLRRKNSNFVDGVGEDANDLAEHICPSNATRSEQLSQPARVGSWNGMR